MIRLFDQHRIRSQRELDGMWRLEAEGKVCSVPVPGCIEQLPDFRSYRGRVLLSRKIYIKKKSCVRLEFKGVSHTAEVLFDDLPVVRHYNAYTAFEAVIADVDAGEHEIKVWVDNSFNEESALHIPNDYYTYGGIIRPAVYEEISPVYIKRLHFTPYREKGVWRGRTEIEIENLGQSSMPVRLDVSLCRKTSFCETEVEPYSVKRIVFDDSYEEAESWSPESPSLYFADAVLSINSQPVDDMIERVGFREIAIDGRRLTINGQPVFLRGFNRHEDYGTIGSALPLQLMAQDIDLMQEMGANAVRTSHYPNDERFLDLCDERGIMVWEENHARGLSIEQMNHPNFERQCEDCIAEMIDQHRNHPAIVIWGILNECASHLEEGRAKYMRQYEQIKGLDKTRPTTSATCHHFSDICLDMPDIVSLNTYTGWYWGDAVDEWHEKEMSWIDSTPGAGKPVIISEFGAGAIYGYRDRSRCKWSEERQSDIIAEHLRTYLEDDRITGVFIWQFADCKVTEENNWFAGRAKCHNNKGVVDEYRRPKESFETVKELFAAYAQRGR